VQVVAVKPVTLVVPSPVGLPGVQLYVYPPAPPVAVFTAAAPLDPPKHETLVCEAGVSDIALGCVIVNGLDDVQPFISVTIQVQVPALKPVTLVVPSP